MILYLLDSYVFVGCMLALVVINSKNLEEVIEYMQESYLDKVRRNTADLDRLRIVEEVIYSDYGRFMVISGIVTQFILFWGIKALTGKIHLTLNRK